MKENFNYCFCSKFNLSYSVGKVPPSLFTVLFVVLVHVAYLTTCCFEGLINWPSSPVICKSCSKARSSQTTLASVLF